MPRKRKTFKYPEQRAAKSAVHYRRALTFFYEIFPGDPEIRWWRNDNAGDQFDIIDKEELEKRIAGAKMCGIPVVDHLPGFCSMMEDCPDHRGYY